MKYFKIYDEVIEGANTADDAVYTYLALFWTETDTTEDALRNCREMDISAEHLIRLLCLATDLLEEHYPDYSSSELIAECNDAFADFEYINPDFELRG